jgi:cytochrome P450
MDTATTVAAAAHWDPYNQTYFADPYPVFRRLRGEAPLYHNEEFDFYALSRYDDCVEVLGDRDTYVSGKGGVVELIKAKIPYPSGMFIYEDPPLHTFHRNLLTRVFTPKRMAALEPDIRQFCAGALDPLIGGEKLDFILHLGSEMPMRVIGMLLGIPEADLKAAQRLVDEGMSTVPGEQLEPNFSIFEGKAYNDYVEWRTKNPSDDLMTDLLNIEAADEHGVTRKLTRCQCCSALAMKPPIAPLAGPPNCYRNILISARKLTKTARLSRKRSRKFCGMNRPARISDASMCVMWNSMASKYPLAARCSPLSLRPIVTNGNSPMPRRSTSIASASRI